MVTRLLVGRNAKRRGAAASRVSRMHVLARADEGRVVLRAKYYIWKGGAATTASGGRQQSGGGENYRPVGQRAAVAFSVTTRTTLFSTCMNPPLTLKWR